MLIVDVLFSLVFVVVMNGELAPESTVFQTRGDCMEARSRLLDAAQRLVAANKAVNVYVGECTAIPVQEVR